ncbi:GIY-YIG nuclease family protein [Acaryochloris sp. CCMEE 5410]|uniref:GIY-YIG nuclease family protein n=1 Tax=Acaryochloris sp. CCMEE 5410 TaxID=310037 RepID=UPI00024852F5|nr:GIY-YIG nuclease family protein [Acaryochloris sp. CCMEE 5410]KAI9131131.1 GIY-YIG nuclease family protein [Acaryochloris sp. CCMEE 5410]
MSEWHLYILRTRDGALYTGVTTDVARRLEEHTHSKKGAKFLRSKGPLQLVYQQPVGSRSEAQRLEYQIKQLSKQQKETFIATHSS